MNRPTQRRPVSSRRTADRVRSTSSCVVPAPAPDSTNSTSQPPLRRSGPRDHAVDGQHVHRHRPARVVGRSDELVVGFVPAAGEPAVVPAGVPRRSRRARLPSSATRPSTARSTSTAPPGSATRSSAARAASTTAARCSNGATSIGPDLTWTNTAAAVVRAETGVLDIEDADFDTDGTVAVDAGARVLVQNDWVAEPTSVLEFEIAGPATDAANYGQFELQSGTFTAAGSLRTTCRRVRGRRSTTRMPADRLRRLHPRVVRIPRRRRLRLAPSVRVITLRGPEIPPELAFDLSVARPRDRRRGPGRYRRGHDRSRRGAARGRRHVGRRCLVDHRDRRRDTGIASISIGATPLSSILLDSVRVVDTAGRHRCRRCLSEIVALWDNVPATSWRSGHRPAARRPVAGAAQQPDPRPGAQRRRPGRPGHPRWPLVRHRCRRSMSTARRCRRSRCRRSHSAPPRCRRSTSRTSASTGVTSSRRSLIPVARTTSPS